MCNGDVWVWRSMVCSCRVPLCMHGGPGCEAGRASLVAAAQAPRSWGLHPESRPHPPNTHLPVAAQKLPPWNSILI